MIQSTLNRRQFVTTALAGALYAQSGVSALGTIFEGSIFLRPFAGSHTIASFAYGLLSCDDVYDHVMPLTLRRAIEAELARTDVVADSVAEERRRAEFFA